MGFIDKTVRFILWWFCKGLLYVVDQIYGIIEGVATFSFMDIPGLWNWYAAIGTLLVFFVMTRYTIIYIKDGMNEEGSGNIKTFDIVKRLLVVAFVFAITPMVINIVADMTIAFIKNIGIFIGGVAGLNPSDILLSGFGGVDWRSLDINAKVGGQYLYYPNMGDILLLLFTAIFGILCFGFLALQIGIRMYGIVFKIILAPYAISGIIDKEDQTFSTWCKLMLADFMTNFFQYFFVFVILLITTLPDSYFGGNYLVKIIIFIAGMMAVVSSPSGIAQLIGGDVGVGSAFQQLQNLSMFTTAMKMGGATALTAASAGVVGGAKLKGWWGSKGNSSGGSSGNVMNTMQQASSPSSGGFTIGEQPSSYSPSAKSGDQPTSRSKTGRLAQAIGGGIYNASYSRIMKDVQYKNARGGIDRRDSNFRRIGRMASGFKDAIR